MIYFNVFKAIYGGDFSKCTYTTIRSLMQPPALGQKFAAGTTGLPTTGHRCLAPFTDSGTLKELV